MNYRLDFIHREEFRKEKKTGAGVTTEAIDFYQFVLEVNLTWKGKSVVKKEKKKEAQEVKVNNENERKRRKKLKKKRGVGRPRKRPRLDDEDGDTEDLESMKSASVPETDNDSDVSSMDEEEFLNQHNDLCEVCNTGGELLCCATCNLVFHMGCVRPRLKVLPPDDWSCAYCDSTGVTGFKRDARQRKRAAQAVREMEKARENMREQIHHTQDTKAPEKNGKLKKVSITVKIKGNTKVKEIIEREEEVNPPSDWEKEPQPSTEESKNENKGTPKIESKESPMNVNKDIPKRHFGGEMTLPSASDVPSLGQQSPSLAKKLPLINNRKGSEDSSVGIDIGPGGTNMRQVDQLIDSLSPLNFISPRTRRSRRQPTLYDPQFGAASEWQSDGRSEWKYLSKDESKLTAIIHQVQENTEVKSNQINTLESTSTECKSSITPKSIDAIKNDKDNIDDKPAMKTNPTIEVIEKIKIEDDAEKEDDSKSKETIKEEIIKVTPEEKVMIQKLISKPVQPGRVSKYTSIQCKFCMDDEKLEVCCFCACRICFSKHDKEKTILCDMCDAEYHTFCLNPPLKIIPSDDWYCPTCRQIIAKAKENMQSLESITTKRTSSSKKRSQNSSKSGKKKETIKVETTEKETVSKSANKKKASPDAKKTLLTSKKVTPTKTTTKLNDVVKSDINLVLPQKRGRGRPRKYPKNPEILPTQSSKIHPGEKIKSDPTQQESVIEMEVLKTNPSEEQNVQNNNQTSHIIEDSTEVNCIQDNADDTKSLTKDVNGKDTSEDIVCLSNFKKQLKKNETSDIRTVVEGQFDDASSGDSNNNTVTNFINMSSTKMTIEKNTSQPNEFPLDKKIESQIPDVVGDSRMEAGAQKPMFDSSGLLSPSPNQKSRSGRLVKRNTFHDEIDEHDTELKTATQNSIEHDSNFNLNLVESQTEKVSSLKKTNETQTGAKMVASLEFPKTMKSSTETAKEESSMSAVKNSTDVETLTKSPSIDSQSAATIKSNVDKSQSKQSAIFQVGAIDNKTEHLSDTNLARDVSMIDFTSTSQRNDIVTNVPKDNNEKLNVGSSAPQSGSSVEIDTSTPNKVTKTMPISDIVTNPLHRSKGRTNTPSSKSTEISPVTKVPRRKPGARECMQISRRFGVNVIPQKYMDILMVRKDYFSFCE